MVNTLGPVPSGGVDNRNLRRRGEKADWQIAAGKNEIEVQLSSGYGKMPGGVDIASADSRRRQLEDARHRLLDSALTAAEVGAAGGVDAIARHRVGIGVAVGAAGVEAGADALLAAAIHELHAAAGLRRV
jgi:hypothetical protein